MTRRRPTPLDPPGGVRSRSSYARAPEVYPPVDNDALARDLPHACDVIMTLIETSGTGRTPTHQGSVRLNVHS